jgi:hypothetical protein
MAIEKILCEVCGEKDKSTLHKHHIIERTQLECTNDDYNLAVLCANCHSKVHSGKIKIIGIYPSTKLPYKRVLVFEEGGMPNVNGITEPYYKRKAKSMKVSYGKDESDV